MKNINGLVFSDSALNFWSYNFDIDFCHFVNKFSLTELNSSGLDKAGSHQSPKHSAPVPINLDPTAPIRKFMYNDIEFGVWENPYTRQVEDVSILPTSRNFRPSAQFRELTGTTVHHVYGGGIWFVLNVEHIPQVIRGVRKMKNVILGADLLSNML